MTGARVAGHVIRRKLQQAMGDGDTPPLAGIGAARAWKLAFARQARDAFGLQCDFATHNLRGVTLAEVLEMLPEKALLLVLEGPAEALGLCVLSAPVMSGLAEVMTMGRLAHRQAAPRRPTRIDAALLAPFVDETFEQLEVLLAEDDALVWASGFRFSSFVEEPRPLGLILEDVGYNLLHTTLVLDGGARQGEMLLLLPSAGKGAQPKCKPNVLSDLAFSVALGQQVEDCSVDLDAVLSRVTLSLADVGAWKPGDWLQLPLADLGVVELCPKDWSAIFTAQLGQHRGMRALRLPAQETEGVADNSSLAAFQAEFAGMEEGGAEAEDETFASASVA